MNKLTINSDNDGYKTWLEEVNTNRYKLCVREGFPIYVTGTIENISALDFDGGPMIGRGSEIEGKIIKDIYYKRGFIIEF